MLNSETFHHAIVVDETKCISCTHCIKVCPTEAMRIVDGRVIIREDRCVDCGECMRVCPKNAIGIEHDDLNLLQKYKYRVVFFPSVFIGQFPGRISGGKIYASLFKLGFTHAYEVEQPIYILENLIREKVKQNKGKLPVISSFCPAIVRLIRVKYPALTENIMQLKAPHDMVANFVLDKFEKKGIDRNEIGFFYVTPCVAKIAAVKSPVAETKSIIDGIINMKALYNSVMAIAENVEPVDTFAFRSELTKEGILWSLTDGESSCIPGRTIAVDGIHNVIRFLERLENDEVKGVDFLELRACDQSCAGGTLLAQNRFLTVERLNERSRRYPSIEKIKLTKDENEYSELKKTLHCEEIKPRPMLRFEGDRASMLLKMQRVRSIMCHLPGIDCAACGAPTCQALADDMVSGKAKMSDCIFIQQLWQKHGKMMPEKAFNNIIKKWGLNRLEPDCTKKGAKNEGF